MCKYVCTCACYHICMCTYVRTCRITYMYIFETIFATILLQTYLDRIKWSDTTRKKYKIVVDSEGVFVICIEHFDMTNYYLHRGASDMTNYYLKRR